MNTILEQAAPAREVRPRLGFVGVGWIGRNRMQAIVNSGSGSVAVIVEPQEENVAAVLQEFPRALIAAQLEALFDADLDGVVVATPSALHAAQCIALLEAGLPVFCQKPLGRNAEETRAVVAAARTADRLLGVDLSYRYTEAAQVIKGLVDRNELGRIYSLDLTFHNAYGPDKPWFYDAALSGGGCVIDLGIHLVDLALWLLGTPPVERVHSALYVKGERLLDRLNAVEDYATATLNVADGITVRLACSWRLHAGQDAVIEAVVYGSEGGAGLRNVNGSFYDFTAEHYRGTRRKRLATPPDAWDGRAAVAWAQQLTGSSRYDRSIEQIEHVAQVLDRIYQP